MNVKEALGARCSCRAFTAETVTRAQIEAIVAAASRTGPMPAGVVMKISARCLLPS
jgi:hypothetical protein